MKKLNVMLSDTILLIVLPTVAFNITGSHLATFVVFLLVLIWQD